MWLQSAHFCSIFDVVVTGLVCVQGHVRFVDQGSDAVMMYGLCNRTTVGIKSVTRPRRNFQQEEEDSEICDLNLRHLISQQQDCNTDVI